MASAHGITVNYSLGSITAISDAAGNMVESLSYDHWGRRRKATDWNDYNVTSTMFDRGFTDHSLSREERNGKHLPQFGLINMNGRVYDPFLARFLSPDPFVQAPSYTQNYNRYSYAFNNPLKYTDPDGEFVQFIIGGIIGGVSGYMIADKLGYKGWDKFWYTLGGAAIGTATAGIGTAVTSSAGIVAGGLVGGAVGGTGFGTMGGYAAGLRGADLIGAGFTGMWKGAVTGLAGSVVGGAIGGGWGALSGGATSGAIGTWLNGGSGDDILKGAAFGAFMGLGVYHVSSYVNWRSNVKNEEFYGRSIKYKQYLKMQASYTRGKFWGSEKAGGGFWLTKDGISKQGVSYDQNKGNVVNFDFAQKPEGAWATFHPHPYNVNRVPGGNLWHSPDDLGNVAGKGFSSLIINKHGAELVTPVSEHRINFWNYGKPYYIYPWIWK